MRGGDRGRKEGGFELNSGITVKEMKGERERGGGRGRQGWVTRMKHAVWRQVERVTLLSGSCITAAACRALVLK